MKQILVHISITVPVPTDLKSTVCHGLPCTRYIEFSKTIIFSTLYGKKHHSTLEMDTFKGMLLLSYITSLDDEPRIASEVLKKQYVFL